MTRLRIMLVWMAMGLSVASYAATSSEEDRAFEAASKSFNGEFWARAEREFQEFTIRFPLSARVPEAVLRQAQALVELNNNAGAVQLLQENLGQAGMLRDEYLFWIAEAHFRAGNNTAAAEAFERVAREFPTSKRALESVLGQATSRARLQQWDRVIEVLEDPEGVLATAPETVANHLLLARGRLLLAEAYLERGDFETARKILESPQLEMTNPTLDWQKQRLQAETLLASGQLPEALAASSNLVSTATAASERVRLAQAVLFQGRVLEEMGDVDAAFAAYRQNLSTNVPPAVQRQTLLRLSELLISHDRLTAARSVIEQYLTLNVDPATADLARLTLAELKIRQHMRSPGRTGPDTSTATNLLEQAINDLNQVIQSAPSRKVRGEAFLNLGWAEWLRGNYSNSSDAFEQAATLLPPSPKQVTAQYKWADSQFRLGQFDRACTNYEAVATAARSVGGEVRDLVEPALYQSLRSGIELKQPALTTNVLDRLLHEYPHGFYASTSVLLTGQELNQAGDPAGARALFEKFLRQSPQSFLTPEIQLAIARTYEAEGDWQRAIDEYDSILAGTDSASVIARAQFFRNWDTACLGDEAAALSQFTNFVVVHADSALAPRAQWWIGDYYWRQRDYVNAELNYQLLFKNWPNANNDLAYKARMMAGRAAMARARPEDAIPYFTNLTSDLKCPPELKPKAMFAYGDALMQLKSTVTNDPVANYAEAIKVFSSIERNYPSNSMAARADGMMGDCYLQLARTDPRAFLAASNAYQQAMSSPVADISTRSQAEVGLAVVLEAEALKRSDETRAPLLQKALDHYLNVFYEKNLREGENADPFWIKKSGLEAGRLAEMLQLYTQARKVYERLLELLPVLQPLLENKILKMHQASPSPPE